MLTWFNKPVLFEVAQNKTGLQPVSRTCGTTPFEFQDSRRKKHRGTKFSDWTPKMDSLTPKPMKKSLNSMKIEPKFDKVKYAKLNRQTGGQFDKRQTKLAVRNIGKTVFSLF